MGRLSHMLFLKTVVLSFGNVAESQGTTHVVLLENVLCPSLISLVVSVDVQHDERRKKRT